MILLIPNPPVCLGNILKHIGASPFWNEATPSDSPMVTMGFEPPPEKVALLGGGLKELLNFSSRESLGIHDPIWQKHIFFADGW